MPIDSASATSASAIAPLLSAPTWLMPIPGSAGVGRPPGTSAITATPWASRSNARLATTATAVTTSAHGTLGATRRSDEKRRERQATDERCLPADVVERFDLAPQHLGHVAALDGQAEELGQLADDDQDADPADESDQHRAGEELRDEAEPERAGDHEHDPGQEGERGEQRRVLLGRERRCDGGERRCRSDRDGRARADVELTARAEDGVEHARRERRREPRLGGRAGEGRVRDGLRHEHRPDGEAGEQVCSQERALIARQPLRDRDVARDAFRHRPHSTAPFCCEI